VCRCSTVEQIALAAGVSRRTFFRYCEAKEDVMVERSDQFGELLLAELAKRPPHRAAARGHPQRPCAGR
jgi:AcrR family transcriptional regulator